MVAPFFICEYLFTVCEQSFLFLNTDFRHHVGRRWRFAALDSIDHIHAFDHLASGVLPIQEIARANMIKNWLLADRVLRPRHADDAALKRHGGKLRRDVRHIEPPMPAIDVSPRICHIASPVCAMKPSIAVNTTPS